MNFIFEQATGFLRSYIKEYCFMESVPGNVDIVERVIPTENVQLMFHYKKPFVILQSNNIKEHQPKSIISGLSNTFSDVSTNGEVGVVFVSFYPNGACHFFKFPLSEIENKSIDLTEIYSREISEVEEQLAEKKTIKEKVSIIEKFLIKRYSPIALYDSSLINKSIEIVKNSKGQMNTNYLSSCLYTTPKTLERKFSQYLGKTTKQYIKLIRFNEVLLDFNKYKEKSMTEIAYKNGYFDQSHFIKDFKTYTGYTPKEFVSIYRDFETEKEK